MISVQANISCCYLLCRGDFEVLVDVTHVILLRGESSIISWNRDTSTYVIHVNLKLVHLRRSLLQMVD